MTRSLRIQEIPEPSIEVLEDYQLWSSSLLVCDEDGNIPKSGLPPFAHCISGIQEELLEILTTGEDLARNEPGTYNRSVALFNGLNELSTDGTDVIRHQKEFGDTIWYTSNALFLLGKSLLETYRLGMMRHTYELLAEIEPKKEHFEQIAPAFQLVDSMSKLRVSAGNMWEDDPTNVRVYKHIDGNRSAVRMSPEEIAAKGIMKRKLALYNAKVELYKSSGSFLVSANLVLHSVFGSSLEKALEQNIEKIKDRIKKGTIEKTNGVGGDDR